MTAYYHGGETIDQLDNGIGRVQARSRLECASRAKLGCTFEGCPPSFREHEEDAVPRVLD